MKFKSVKTLISETKKLQKGKMSISPTGKKTWTNGDLSMELPYSELAVNDSIVCYDYNPDGFESTAQFVKAGAYMFFNHIDDNELSFCEVITTQDDGSSLVVRIQDELSNKIREKKRDLTENSIYGKNGVDTAIRLYKSKRSFINFQGLFASGDSGEEFIRVREWTSNSVKFEENLVYNTSVITNALSCFELNSLGNRLLNQKGISYIPRTFCVTEVYAVANNE